MVVLLKSRSLGEQTEVSVSLVSNYLGQPSHHNVFVQVEGVEEGVGPDQARCTVVVLLSRMLRSGHLDWVPCPSKLIFTGCPRNPPRPRPFFVSAEPLIPHQHSSYFLSCSAMDDPDSGPLNTHRKVETQHPCRIRRPCQDFSFSFR